MSHHGINLIASGATIKYGREAVLRMNSYRVLLWSNPFTRCNIAGAGGSKSSHRLFHCPDLEPVRHAEAAPGSLIDSASGTREATSLVSEWSSFHSHSLQTLNPLSALFIIDDFATSRLLYFLMAEISTPPGDASRRLDNTAHCNQPRGGGRARREVRRKTQVNYAKSHVPVQKGEYGKSPIMKMKMAQC